MSAVPGKSTQGSPRCSIHRCKTMGLGNKTSSLPARCFSGFAVLNCNSGNTGYKNTNHPSQASNTIRSKPPPPNGAKDPAPAPLQKSPSLRPASGRRPSTQEETYLPILPMNPEPGSLFFRRSLVRSEAPPTSWPSQWPPPTWQRRVRLRARARAKRLCLNFSRPAQTHRAA